jgi:hypothetical protein
MSTSMMNSPNMSNMNHSPTTNTTQSHDMMNMSMSDMGTMLAGKTGEDLDRAFLE